MNLDTMEEEKDMQSDKYIKSVIFKDGEKEVKSIEEQQSILNINKGGKV